ncbi:MAG: cupredoxin domain-containing protein [Candidatus Jorgensenbacteria bacterium]
MQTTIRALVTVFFIGLVVLGAIFFSIFIVAPADKFLTAFKGPRPTSTVVIIRTETPGSPAGTTGGSSVGGPSGETPAASPAGGETQSKPPAVSAPPTPAPPARPQQSSPIAQNQIPTGAIAITVTDSGFSPSRFKVNAGAEATVALTSGDRYTHTLVFDDPALADVAIGVGPRETRAISFYAPDAPGEYAFSCTVPGHGARGEVGTMVVE